MKVEIKGPIISDSEQWIYDWFRIPATSPSKVNKVIAKAVENGALELTLVINSPGGYVFSAAEIWTELKKFKGNVRGEIVGVAASAASVIAMGCSHLAMSPAGTLMIHNASSRAEGDYRDMDHASDLLQKVNETIINTYEKRTGKTHDELKNMMDKESWMTAKEAKALGFIDEIMFENEDVSTIAASADMPGDLENGMLPKNVIDTMRNQLANEKGRAIFNLDNQPQNAITSEQPEAPKNNEAEGGKVKMDLKTFQNEHPELFQEVKNLGIQEGIEIENKRIEAIEDIAMPGNEELVNKAKFETKMTAEQLAVQIIKNDKEKAVNHFKNAQADAQQLQNVGDTQTIPTDVDNEAATVAEFNNIWGGK